MTPSLNSMGYRLSAQMPYELAYQASKLECVEDQRLFGTNFYFIPAGDRIMEWIERGVSLIC